MAEPRISVYEVGLRDGLQNEAAFIPTAEKVRLASMLADAGLTRIELTSFVSPRWIPQLADHAEVARDAERRREPREPVVGGRVQHPLEPELARAALPLPEPALVKGERRLHEGICSLPAGGFGALGS